MKLATVAALIGTLLFPGLVLGQANTASLLNLTTNAVISNFVVGNDPQGVAWFGNNVAFVVNDADNTLVRLDMTTSPPTINQTFTFIIDSNFGPHAVAINPAGTRALVAGDGTSLYILNISTTPFTIVDTISVVADAGGVAYYSGGTRAIVANESNVLILDTTTVPAGVTTVALGNQAHGVAVNAAGTRAVVTIDTGGLQVLDLTTTPPTLLGSVVGPLAGDPLGVAISPDGTRAIYAQESTPSSAAVVIDITGTPSLIGSVPLSILSPSAVAFNPVTGAALIAGDDGVSVLNAPYTSVSATISHPGRRGAASYSLAVNAAGTQALVLHEDAFFCPYPIAFGDVPVGTIATRVETCTNTGSGPLTVTAVSITGPGFGVNGVPALPLVLQPGGTISFNVTFTPPGLGPQTGALTVNTNLFDSNVDTSGNGIAASVVVTPVPALSWPMLALLGLLLAGGAFLARRNM